MTISPDQLNWLTGFYSHFLDGLPDESPTEWACNGLRFNEPGNNGPFTIAGREFLRESLDNVKNFDIQYEVIVSGSQIGKTSVLMARQAWKMKHIARRGLWVMPAIDEARNFSSTRWQPMIESSPAFQGLIPHGSARSDWSRLNQRINGYILNFVGSNSSSKLKSNPVNDVNVDEVESYPDRTQNEADPVEMADQRTKNAHKPSITEASTPKLESGRIWQDLFKGDLRRYFVPCPHCKKEVLLMWSKDFTVLPIIGCEAWVRWDKEAKRGKEWDLDRVVRSARFECPHCGGHIQDGHKPQMIRDGVWKPTKTCDPGRQSRHISSLYANTPKTRIGMLALKFHEMRKSAQGPQGFINGDLAEPWCNQDTAGERIEILVHNNGHISEDAVKIMTVDCQLVSPLFWFVIREWIPAGEHKGDSRGILSGHVDSLTELRDIQQLNKVINIRTALDAGNNQDSVIADFCLQFGEFIKGRFNDISFPVWKGWIPCKGQPKKLWKNKAGLYVPYSFCDLYRERGPQKVCIKMMMHSGDYCKDIMSRLRKHEHTKTLWEVADACGTETYWKHMDAEVLTMSGSKMVWKPRYQKAANHLGDCEALQFPLAIYNGYLTYSRDFTPEKPDNSKVQETKEYTLAKS